MENKRSDQWKKYVDERNKYIQIHREKRNSEKEHHRQCKDQPKLFYLYVNWKLKNKVGINKLQVDGVVYEETGRMVEVMNNCFQKILTRVVFMSRSMWR